MSRIGKKPIEIPQGVTVEMVANKITVSGSKGKLELVLVHDVKVEIKDNLVVVDRANSSKKASAMWGTTNRLIGNMITGVSVGFSKVLELNGVGFRMEASGKNLKMALGFSHPVNFPLPDGISATVDKQNRITLTGPDKEMLGLTAARLRALRKPEPYKGKGVKYAEETITRKVGKAGGK